MTRPPHRLPARCVGALPRALWPALGALALQAACLSPRPPPEPTPRIAIPGGTFTLGPDAEPLRCGGASATEEERCDSGKVVDPLAWIDDLTWVPRARATVAAFEIDEHEVTNLQWAYCVEMGSCTEPAYEELEGGLYHGAVEHERSPVVYVTHDQASAYCAFVGGRLPTEAEWERAARLVPNGTLRTYPWAGGQLADCNPSSARYALSKGCGALPAPVDDSGGDRTALGVRNMASNVSEWVADEWDPYSYCEAGKPYPASCQQQGTACPACAADGALCAASCVPDKLVICKAGTYSARLDASATEFVSRGGSYLRGRCDHRLYVRRRETAARDDLGLRCAR